MVKIFFSYSHRDEDLRDELEIHLSSLKRQGIISTWHDRRIVPGDEFNNEISEYLENANIILLLVSPYFIDSDYCYNIEMTRAIEKHNNREAVVIPVILHPCDWHDMPFGKILVCPTDGKPISKFPNIHDAFLEVTKSIKKAADKFYQGNQKSGPIDVNFPIDASKKVQSLRSSNLRLKKEFTDRDKDSFLVEAFEYIAKYFEGSLQELKTRNSDFDIDFRRVHANRFTATIYHKGKEASKCNIWLSDDSTFMNGINYSFGNNPGNSINESLNVENDGYTMFLKSMMGFHTYMQDKEPKMTFEGGAEFYWSKLIERLQ